MSETASYHRVTKALARRIPAAPDAVVRIVADDLGAPLAQLLDPQAVVSLAGSPSYATAEAIVSTIEKRDPVVRLVLLVGDEWSRRFLSAAGVRPWPVVFEPLRGLTSHERPDFVRRACNAARAGKAVWGVKPWRSLDVDASKR